MSIDHSAHSERSLEPVKQSNTAESFGKGGLIAAFRDAPHSIFKLPSNAGSQMHTLEIVDHSAAADARLLPKVDPERTPGPARDSARSQAGAPDATLAAKVDAERTRGPATDSARSQAGASDKTLPPGDTTPQIPGSQEHDRASSKPDGIVNFDKIAHDLKTAKPGERQKILADGLAQYQKSHGSSAAVDFSGQLNGALEGSGLRTDFDGSYGSDGDTHGFGAVRLRDESKKTVDNPLGVVAAAFAGTDQAQMAAFQAAQQINQKIDSFLDKLPPGERQRARNALENQIAKRAGQSVDDGPDGLSPEVHNQVQKLSFDVATQFHDALSPIPNGAPVENFRHQAQTVVHWFQFMQTSGTSLPDL